MNCIITDLQKNGCNGFIYVIEHDFALKVGFSVTPEHRIHQLQSANYLKLRTIAIIPASFQDERIFHKVFKSQSLGREWYPIEFKRVALEYLRNVDITFYRDGRTKKQADRHPDLLTTNRDKIAYIRKHFNLDCLLVPGKVWTAESLEIIQLASFGVEPKHANKLGFKVPILANGEKKGSSNSIRYTRVILNILGYDFQQIKKARPNKTKANVLNTYSVIRARCSEL